MRTGTQRYKPDAYILFQETAQAQNLKRDGKCLYLQLSKQNADGLRRSKKAWGMTWDAWASEILELIEEHG